MSDQMSEGSGPQPGWYQDPSGPGYRWWDGTSWTDQTHPGTQQQEEEATTPAPAQSPAAPDAPAATTPGAAKATPKPAKAKKGTSSASQWLNDNPLPVVLVLAALLAVVVVLFVL